MPGEYAEIGFTDEEIGEVIDGESPGHPRRMSDRRREHEFKATRPTKDCPCIVPGCAKKFRPSTAYRDFLDHWRQKHGGK